MPIPTPSASAVRATRPVRVAIDSATTLAGEIAIAEHPTGLVIVADGSGASLDDPDTQFLADTLHQYGLATLVIDLLNEHEEAIDGRTGRLRYDMALLSNRIVASGAWAQRDSQACGLPVGLFGTRTAAGAALVAVTQQPRDFQAVVSYAGRPDLAGSALGRVMIPTLFIVESGDDRTSHLCRHTIDRMHNEPHLEVIAHAAGAQQRVAALDQVARLSADWFTRQLGK